MQRRLWLLLALALFLVSVLGPLSSPGASPFNEMAFGAPGPTETPMSEEEAARARAVPRIAEERDRLRASQVSRAAGPGAPTLATTAAATGVAVSPGKFGFAVFDVATGSGSTLAKVPQAGAGWMMGWVSWRNVEPSRGSFAWASGGANDLDKLTYAASSYGLKPLVHFFDPPAWATYDGSGSLYQVNPQYLQDAMQAIARHAAGKVMGYELFNEPNLNYEWGRDVDATQAAGYVTLVKAA
jgi:hypothetical protein